MIAIDSFTKFIMADSIPNKNAKKVKNMVEEWEDQDTYQKRIFDNGK